MHTRSYIHSRSGSRDGVALIAVLVFIVLLTILTVSYIAFTGLNRLSTISYSKSIQAQEVAQGGLQDILSDLHNEIIAGSIKDSGGVYTPSSGGPTIYVPATNLTAVPARIGYVASVYNVTNATPTQISTTLIRVSRCTNNAGATFFTSWATSPYTNNQAAIPGGLPILDRASQASTTNADLGGRYISAARWNKTYLLATNSSASVIPTPFATNAPDWVYVTRTGSRSCLPADLPSLKPSSNVTQNYGATVPGQNPPASPVVGRYAFVMYDEGALLDVSIAGSPSSLMTNNGTATAPVSSPLPTFATNSPSVNLAYTGKSYLSFADLTQLPGLTGTAGQTAVTSLLNWRYAGSMSTYGNTGSNFLQIVLNYAQNGFLSFSSGDSPLVGRQDLINYFANYDNVNGTTTSQALPYLSTFSRAVSAPSYYPPLDPANIPGYTNTLVTASPPPTYYTSKETTGVANRDLANVRYPSSISAGTLIKHYADDTSTTQYSVNPGDPILQNRFSLARIGWLSSKDIGGADAAGTTNPATGAGPSASYKTAIQACFGLKWGIVSSNANGGNACWSYIGSNNNFNGTIETLDVVAGQGREPNFFELLKAAILSGSLGLNPGPAAYDNGKFDLLGHAVADYPSYASYGTGDAGIDDYYGSTLDGHTAGQPSVVPAPAQISDMQIMQIGANIIDEYDADSYPTAIYFPYTAIKVTNYDAASGSYTGVFGPTDMVYGDENLPCLSGLGEPVCTTDGSAPINYKPSPNNVGPLGGWWQPQVWNPHQQPNAISAIAPPPSQFIIAAYGTSKIGPTSDVGGPNTPLDGQLISFTINNPLTAFCANEVSLTQTSVIAIPGVSSVTTSSSAAGVTAAQMKANSSMNGYTLNPFVGFSMGIDTSYSPPQNPSNPATIPSPYTAGYVNAAGYGEPVATFCLGWSANGTDFHPYSYIPGIFCASYGKDQYVTPVGDETAWSADLPTIVAEEHGTLDPRTHHLPSWAYWSGSYTANLWPSNAAYAHSSVASGWGVPTPSNFVYPTTLPFGYGAGQYAEDWMVNQASPAAVTKATATYYVDPDGVIRPGDGLWANASSGDGLMLFTSAASPGGGVTAALGDSSGNTQHGRRPVILNRPFRSVGELGYVFRDLPFKSLDFWSASSADAALLDIFSLTDESKVIAVNATTNQLNSVVAGQFNPSNAPIPVIQAVLSGGSKKDLDPTYNLGAEAPATSPTVLANLAAAIANSLNPTTGTNPFNPILNRAALATQIIPSIQTIKTTNSGPPHFTVISTIVSPFTASSPDIANKAYLESPVRALADVTNTRTWNLMIDIIAQSGQMSSTAKTLNDFVVQGEKRYWLHVAIDRYTGKIVSQQLEPVYE